MGYTFMLILGYIIGRLTRVEDMVGIIKDRAESVNPPKFKVFQKKETETPEQETIKKIEKEYGSR